MKTLLLLLFATSIHTARAQPKMHDSGLIIYRLRVKNHIFLRENGVWVNQSQPNVPAEPHLSSSHYLLDKKLRPSKKELAFIHSNDYNLAEQPSPFFSYYLPPYIKRKNTPNHRIIFVYDADSMVVDFLNIPSQSFSSPPSLPTIFFKPGHYVFNFYGDPALSPTDKNEITWLNYYSFQGITPESEPYLLKYGKLTYSPPSNYESVMNYVVPEVIVEQKTPFLVTIKLNGYFLGRIMEIAINEPIISTYFQVEIFKDGVWTLHPIGWVFKSDEDSTRLGKSFFNKTIFRQLESHEDLNQFGSEPGRYRVRLITPENETIFSPEFSMGMLPANQNNPYQLLYRENSGFPNYTRDASDNISIMTGFYPLESGTSDSSFTTYHFKFPWSFDDRKNQFGMNYAIHPEIIFLKELITLITTKKVSINGNAYSGRIKFAFSYSSFHVNAFISQINIYVVDYLNGMPVRSEILKDVDLENERTPIRVNGE